MDWLKNMFKKHVLMAFIPVFALLIGLSLFIYGTFGSFESLQWKEFWAGLGKTLFASGIFALLLKTFQFMGVFKDELSKVVYDPKFLAKRRDLPEIWEGVSKELFKNKFTGISKRLLKDVTEVYFPTDHSTYYDDLEQFISIRYIDEGKVEVSYIVNLNIICATNEKCTYEYSSTLTFKNDQSEVEMIIKKVEVDNEAKTPIHSVLTNGNQVIDSFKLHLSGKEKYKIKRDEIKKYFLDNDNIMYFRAAKITNNVKIDIQHPEDLVIDFKKCGTISDFELRKDTTTFKQYRYNGILYPQQGYIITLNKK
jgi:hypothetical protein